MEQVTGIQPEDGITSLEGVQRTAVSAAELAIPMLLSSRDGPLFTVLGRPGVRRFVDIIPEHAGSP